MPLKARWAALAQGSSLYLYLDVPDLVAKSIVSLVRELRAQ